MSSISMELLHVDSFVDKIKAMGPEAEKRVMKSMVQAMLPVQDEIKKSLTSDGKSGKVYYRGQKYDKASERYHAVTHQASAPGEAPSSDSGELRKKISLPIPDRETLSVSIVSAAPYSSELEYGTSKMAARPFMAPAFRHNKAYMKEMVRISLKALHII